MTVVEVDNGKGNGEADVQPQFYMVLQRKGERNPPPKVVTKRVGKRAAHDENIDAGEEEHRQGKQKVSVSAQDLINVLLDTVEIVRKNGQLTEAESERIQDVLHNFGHGDFAYWTQKLVDEEDFVAGQ
jgi:dissimilatory sulfite reductase (desulfoviridin) alpha/beta subunit